MLKNPQLQMKQKRTSNLSSTQQWQRDKPMLNAAGRCIIKSHPIPVSLHIVCWDHMTRPSSCESSWSQCWKKLKKAVCSYSTHNKDYISNVKCSSSKATSTVVTVNAAGFNQGHGDVMQTHTCRARWRIYSKQRTWRLAYGLTWDKPAMETC